MNYRVILCLVLPIFIMVFGLTVNFYEFFSGSPATIKNLIVTFFYMSIWVMCLVIAFNAESLALMRFYSIIWLLTLGIAGLTAYINYTDTTVNFGWAIPFAVLFLAQWIGLNFLIDSYLVLSLIITIISLIMFITITSIIRRWKRVF